MKFHKKTWSASNFCSNIFYQRDSFKKCFTIQKKKKIQLLIWQIYTQQHHHQKIISLYHHLKELQNHILCIICELSFFFSLQVCIFYLLLCKTSFLSVCFFCFSQVLNWCHTYIKAIWLSVIFFSLYKNYFLFIKVRFWHMLVKTCFQRSFELIKNHL